MAASRQATLAASHLIDANRVPLAGLASSERDAPITEL
jgi:hypothetical protein